METLTQETDPMAEEILNTQRKQAVEDAVGAAVARDPLPGKVATAMSPKQESEESGYTIREFRDADFAHMKELSHPLACLSPASIARMKQGDLSGAEVAASTLDSFLPSGEDFWVLCWLMTNPPLKAREMLKQKEGKQLVKDLAFEQFGQLDSMTLAKLAIPIVDQFVKNCGVVLQHGAPKAEGEGDPNPTSAGPS